MAESQVSWWKKPFGNTSVWFWLNAKSGTPFRMMFAAPPPTSTMGTPNNLAFFQMFSFSYLVDLNPYTFADLPSLKKALNSTNNIPIQCGNPFNYKLFEWNSHFSMTNFMVPVDYRSNPLPTRVVYKYA